MKDRYNIDRGELSYLPTYNTIFIRHCSSCDTAPKRGDMFLDWLKIIEVGSMVKGLSTKPYLDLKHLSKPFVCLVCKRTTLVQVIFEWVNPNDFKET